MWLSDPVADSLSVTEIFQLFPILLSFKIQGVLGSISETLNYVGPAASVTRAVGVRAWVLATVTSQAHPPTLSRLIRQTK